MSNFLFCHDIFLMQNKDRWDSHTYERANQAFGEVFHLHAERMVKVIQLAQGVYRRFSEISPFIEKVTNEVCPSCNDICCIARHGFYNCEDLIYMYALGLVPPPPDFARKETDPCQFLSSGGCTLHRAIRPSGCNWYFCEALFDSMEILPGYHVFDETLGGVAELWMNMVSEFMNAGILLPD
ncbi:MAG: hypothetical protein ACOYVJ_05935 [Nitrospirota bacterium]